MIPRRRPDAPLQRISRRGLITSGVLAGVLAATGVQVAAQRRGGHLRVALPDPFDGWGIGPQNLTARIAHAGAVFDTLTEVTASGQLVGELARGWEASGAGAVWTFALRSAVWHDGNPVTAGDAAQSLLRHAGPAAPMAARLAHLRDVAVLAPDLLRLTLDRPDPDLPLILSDPHLVIAPGGALEAGIGSGLYRAVDTDAGGLSLNRLARHYKDGQAGWFDSVTLRWIPDEGERFALLAAGKVDVAITDSAPPGARLVEVAASGSLLLAPPLPLPDAVRRAFAAADRLARLDALESGHAPDPASFCAAIASGLRHPMPLGDLAALDSARIAERWWFG